MKLLIMLSVSLIISSGCINDSANKTYKTYVEKDTNRVSRLERYDMSTNQHIFAVIGGSITDKGKEFRRITVWLLDENDYDDLPEYPSYMLRKFPHNIYEVSLQSDMGKKIIDFVETEKPWEWEKYALPEVNHLCFWGNINSNKWDYYSVYPDKKYIDFQKKLYDIIASNADDKKAIKPNPQNSK